MEETIEMCAKTGSYYSIKNMHGYPILCKFVELNEKIFIGIRN